MILYEYIKRGFIFISMQILLRQEVYVSNYIYAHRMDLAETMKNIVAKGMQTEMGPPGGGSSYSAAPSSAGYVTEKIYMLLQAYLQNKGWNPSIEFLQCFSEFKDASMMPSTAYLQ